MNFFSWIRTGVRQAVLLGVNDAVDTIGEPTENSKFREELTLAIEQGDPQALPAKKGSRKSSAPKRLGRSLKDVEPVGKKGD